MVAVTAASHLGVRICWNPADAVIVWGKLAGTYHPGDVVYESAAGVWTQQSSNTGNLYRSGVVLDKPRVGTDWARKDIDDAYTTSDQVPIGISGVFTVHVTDQGNATLKAGVGLILSATAGSLTIVATMFSLHQIAVNLRDVADDDLFTIAAFGTAMFTAPMFRANFPTA
jgi:hypothetical protein